MRPSASPISSSAQRSQNPSAPRSGACASASKRASAIGVARGEIGRHAADRADPALDIVEPDVAFGGGVELEHLRIGRTGRQRAPDVGRNAVAEREPQLVRFSAALRRRGDEIAAEFADILERRAVPARDVVPEPARRESFARSRPSRRDERRADRDDAADAVVHRQAIVEAIVGASSPARPANQWRPGDDAAMADLRRLRQPGRARGEDSQRAIVERHLAPLALAERRRAQRVDGSIDAESFGRRAAMRQIRPGREPAMLRAGSRDPATITRAPRRPSAHGRARAPRGRG